MRISPPQQPILFGILVHLLVVGVASSRIGVSYQQPGAANCRPKCQQMPSQNCYQSGEGDGDCDGNGNGNGNGDGDGGGGGGMGMGMSRPMNPKHGASNIAQQAAQDAKKASDTQLPAAVAAARKVKLQLADRAAAAAWAAEAALSGKQEVVEQLKTEVHEAEIVFQDESASLGVAQNNLNAATCTANQANELLQKLQDIIKTAKETKASAEASVCGAHKELIEKNKLVEAAQHRVELLVQQLRNAKMEYENTKKAAYRASCAAAEARQKAMRERRDTAQEINDYMDKLKKHYQAQEQAQMLEVGQKHQQTPVEEPLQKINSKQMQPEEWDYNQHVKAKFAGGAQQRKKRRFSGNNMRAYREPQQQNHQQTQVEAELQKAQQKYEDNVHQNQPEQWE